MEVAFQERVLIRDTQLQTDGKLVGVGTIGNPGPDLDHFLFRLLVDGSFDPTFHGNGARSVQFGQVPDGDEGALARTLSGGRLVTVGPVEVDGVDHFGISRATSALVFRDGFERGSAAGWGGS